MAYSQCFPLLLEIVAQIFERAELPFNKTVYKNGTYLLEMFKMHIEKFQNKIVFLLLIDELDTLAKHDQKNFELINDLLNMKDTCLVKIGISNTLDLFAKYKGTKQYVECKQMAFKPYGDEDLWGILKERMEGSLKKTRVRLEDLIDKDGMVKVCRKIQKNAFGDIRVMLSIVKDIFERKLSTLKADCAKRKSLHSSDKIGDEDYEVGPAETRITLMEAMGVVDEKYGDVQREIVKSLSLPLQTCLLALYFGMEEKNHVVKYAVFQGKLKECMEAMGVPWSHQDLEANLMSLEVYKFLKLKPLKQTKAPVAAQQCDLESNFDKKDLRGYLRDLPALALFFDREEDD